MSKGRRQAARGAVKVSQKSPGRCRDFCLEEPGGSSVYRDRRAAKSIINADPANRVVERDGAGPFALNSVERCAVKLHVEHLELGGPVRHKPPLDADTCHPAAMGLGRRREETKGAAVFDSGLSASTGIAART